MNLTFNLRKKKEKILKKLMKKKCGTRMEGVDKDSPVKNVTQYSSDLTMTITYLSGSSNFKIHLP